MRATSKPCIKLKITKYYVILLLFPKKDSIPALLPSAALPNHTNVDNFDLVENQCNAVRAHDRCTAALLNYSRAKAKALSRSELSQAATCFSFSLVLC